MYNATNVLLKNSNRQLTKKEIENEVQPFYSFVGSAKSGRLTRELYIGLMLANYNYLRLINELCKLRLAKSDDDNLMLHLSLKSEQKRIKTKWQSFYIISVLSLSVQASGLFPILILM